MIELAEQRNRPLIEAARVDVILSNVESLPFPDDMFDKAVCVHVLYFWKDIGTSLREIARVLKPGGCLGLLFRTNADMKSSRHSRRKSSAFGRWPTYWQRSNVRPWTSMLWGVPTSLLLSWRRNGVLELKRSGGRDRGETCDHSIDLGRCGAPSQAEADRSHSNSLRYPHGGENG